MQEREFTTIIENLVQIKDKVSEIDNKANKIENIVGEVDTKVNGLERKVKEIDIRINKFESNTESRFDKIEDKLDDIQSQLDLHRTEIKQSFQTLSEQVIQTYNLDRRVTRLEIEANTQGWKISGDSSKYNTEKKINSSPNQ